MVGKGMVQAYVGQKLLKRDILGVFTMSLFYNISGDYC
jgi:hypothetical protein